MAEEHVDGMCQPCKDAKTRNWSAWNDLRPPLPDFFHIMGEVYVPNIGVDPLLVEADPQGINPSILILDLYLCQRPGMWPQVFVWKPVRFEKKIIRGYTHAEIRCGDEVIATVEVRDVH